MVLEEEEITNDTLLKAVQSLYQNRASYSTAMKGSKQTDSIQTIIQLIEDACTHAES